LKENVKRARVIEALFFLLLMLTGCSSNEPSIKQNQPIRQYTTVKGPAQGTSCVVTYYDSLGRDFAHSIDSLLIAFDNSVSTYNSSSLITEFNHYKEVELDSAFYHVFQLSKQVYTTTNGLFNPALYPLINAWGFGDSGYTDSPTEQEIDSLLKRIDLTQIELKSSFCGAREDRDCFKLISKTGLQLNFNAIAQGYSVDLLAFYLEERGIYDYYVNIGGEIRVSGQSPSNKEWVLGIEEPREDGNLNHALMDTLKLTSGAMATSGNYRKFYEIDGIKYSHTINPLSGKPVKHSLLSATVVTDNCALADAYATAFMVMGLEKGKDFIENHPELNLKVYFIYDKEGSFKTFVSDDLQQSLRAL